MNLLVEGEIGVWLHFLPAPGWRIASIILGIASIIEWIASIIEVIASIIAGIA
ncbi:hypothetical protein [Bacillus sp. FJAT-27251]|uniref:hypothetical protein n=1 Tax=Bacillus sp. FJAT-27251 TaxID=1684142 RepID=UPI0012E30945|nr:hypothetical protein [Bacillus sp. FJAT-27251]